MYYFIYVELLLNIQFIFEQNGQRIYIAWDPTQYI